MAQLVATRWLVFPLMKEGFRVCHPLLARGDSASATLNHQNWTRAEIDCYQLANRDVHPESVHTAPEGLDRPEKIGSPLIRTSIVRFQYGHPDKRVRGKGSLSSNTGSRGDQGTLGVDTLRAGAAPLMRRFVIQCRSWGPGPLASEETVDANGQDDLVCGVGSMPHRWLHGQGCRAASRRQ